MAELQTLKRVVLKETRASSYDLESQRPITALTRRQRNSALEPPKWFNEFRFRQISKLTRPIAQDILLPSMYAAISRTVPTGLLPLSTSAKKLGQPATSLSTEPSKPETDSKIPLERQQINEYYDDLDGAELSSRSSDASTSFVSSTFVVQDAREDDHSMRLEAITKYLDPLLPLYDTPRNEFILICWGKSNNCHIKSVFFEHESTEVDIWKNIHHAWSVYRNSRNKFFKRFFTVKSVEIVTLLIAGKRETQETHRKRKSDESLSGGLFSNIDYIGRIFKDDISAETSRLQDDIAAYVPQPWPCIYIPALGTTQCDPTCVTGSIDVLCPEKELFDRQRKLLQLKMIPFLRLAFMHPDIATVNSVLDRENTVYTRSEVVSRLSEWHCPSLGELPFRAIFIEDGWTFSDFTTTLPLVVAVLLLLILGCRFVYGDWGIAWNVGYFFATLAVAVITERESSN